MMSVSDTDMEVAEMDHAYLEGEYAPVPTIAYCFESRFASVARSCAT